MDVTIQEKRFSLRNTYTITSPNASFTADRKIFSLIPHITDTHGDSAADTPGTIAAVIRGTSIFRARYIFEVPNSGNAYTFNRVSLWKSIYTCEGNGSKYTFYEHRGMKSSIFQNSLNGDLQIASLSKNRLVIGTGNTISLRMNSDAEVLLLACMAIAVNTTRSKNEKQAGINFDMGNMAGQGRSHDETWQPR